MSGINKRIEALKKAAQSKRSNTLLKVTTVINIMKEKNLPINFGSVSKLSGVSKTWLYKQPELKLEISQIRVRSGTIERVIDQRKSIGKMESTLLSLKARNKKLREIIKKLRRQVEVVYGELYSIKKADRLSG